MREQEPQNHQSSQCHSSIVIETFDDGPYYSVVTSCEALPDGVSFVTINRDGRIREPLGKTHFLYLRKPNNIEFGDHLSWNEDEDEWHLLRGPILKFRLTPDDFPPQILNQLQSERNL